MQDLMYPAPSGCKVEQKNISNGGKLFFTFAKVCNTLYISMHKLLHLLLLSIILLPDLQAQPHPTPKPLGAHIDLEGQMIHDFVDLDFASANPLLVAKPFINNTPPPSFDSRYYTNTGEAEQGSIYLLPGSQSFTFKKGAKTKKQLINPSIGWSIKVDADSFIVANNFIKYGKKIMLEKASPTPRILKVIATTDAFSFYEIAYSPELTNFIVRVKASNEFIALPLEYKSFITVAFALFKEYPQLLEYLENKKLPHDKTFALIKFIQYTEASRNNQPLTLTSTWEVTDVRSRGVYQAHVSHINDQWKLDFSTTKGEKLFTEHYLYSNPETKNGDFIWYFPDTGIMRKKIGYTNDIKRNSHYFYHTNGRLHYEIIPYKEGGTRYVQVIDTAGNSVLDAKDRAGIESFYDESTNRTLIRAYENAKLLSSYYTDELGRKIYQYAQKNASINSYKSVQRNVATYIQYPLSDISNQVEGTVLVRVIVDPSGQISESRILQGLTNTADQAALSILTDKFVKLRFSAGKQDNEKVIQEMIIPVYFVLQQAANPGSRFYYHHPFPNPAMMPVTPPSIPRF
jgi:TonB family protein